MNRAAIQLETPELSLARAVGLREMGVLVLACSEQGVLGPARPVAEDWLAGLLTGSALFVNAVKDAAGAWALQEPPQPLQAMPGLWLAPVARLVRRRRCGYDLAVLITPGFLECEQLGAMCQAARADLMLTRDRISQLPPVAECDVSRLAMLVRLAREDHQRLTADSRAVESVSQQLAESYEEINLLYTIIRSMTVVQQPQRFVSVVCDELLATLPYTWVGAQLATDADSLKRLSGRLVLAGEAPTSLDVLQRLAMRLLSEAQPDTPMVLQPGSNPKHADFAPLGRTVAVHPVSRDQKVLGLLIAGEKRGADAAVSSVDMKLLGATATHMAIFLENAALYDDLNAMFLGTLEALSASIDAKDRYTCGHSQRVARLTQELGRVSGMDGEPLSRLRIAGLVHDVGKIGVPEAVLCKPGKLTEAEFAWIRKHPEIGYRILKDIPQLKDVLPGVLHHHERWDGKGYPHGLAGEKIPFIARLIALADTFDAMSSNRAYRTALSRGEVLAEIRRCAGTQFDPQLAGLFVQLDFSEYDRMIAEHRAADHALAEKGKAA